MDNIRNQAQKLADSISSISTYGKQDEIVAGNVVSVYDDGRIKVAIDNDIQEINAIPCGDFSVGDRVVCASNKSGNVFAMNKIISDSNIMSGVAQLTNLTPKVGATVRVLTSGLPGDAEIGYQWYRPGVPIESTDSDTYTVTIDDLNSYIFCRIYDKSGKYRGLVTSDETEEITAGELIGNISLSNYYPKPLEVIECIVDGAQYNAVLSYQWYRGEDIIVGETDKKYKTTSVDNGYIITCKVSDRSGKYYGHLEDSTKTEMVYEQLTGTIKFTGKSYIQYFLTPGIGVSGDNVKTQEIRCETDIDQKDAKISYKWYANGLLFAQTGIDAPYTYVDYEQNFTTITVEAIDASGKYVGSIISDPSNICGYFYGSAELSKTEDIHPGDIIKAEINTPIDDIKRLAHYWIFTETLSDGSKKEYVIPTWNVDEIEVPKGLTYDNRPDIQNKSVVGMTLRCEVSTALGYPPLYATGDFKTVGVIEWRYLSGISTAESEPIARTVSPITGSLTLSKNTPYVEMSYPLVATVDTGEDTSEIEFLYTWHRVAQDGTDSITQESTSNEYTLTSDDHECHIYCEVQDYNQMWYTGKLKSEETLTVFSQNDTFAVHNTGTAKIDISYKVINPELVTAGVYPTNQWKTNTAVSDNRETGSIEIQEFVHFYDVQFTVTEIFNASFGNPLGSDYTRANEIILPKTVVKIGDYAFRATLNIKKIDLTNIEELGRYCFHGSGIEEIVGLDKNDKLTALPDYCFKYCKSLKRTHLGDSKSIKTLGTGCFQESNIYDTDLDRNNVITSLPQYCFQSCNNLTVTGLGGNSSVKTLGTYCFSSCNGLQDTGFGNNNVITAIPAYCFQNCTSLIETGLGTNSTIKTVNNRCFDGCSALEYTGLGTNSTITAISGTFCFSRCSSLLHTGLETNNTIKSIGTYCFQSCTSLLDTGLDTNTALTSLPNYCFQGCTSLVDTGLGTNNTIKTLGTYCFSGCTSLVYTGLDTNKTITTLNSYCFTRCGKIENVVLPEQLIYATNAFTGYDGVNNIKKVEIRGTQVRLSSNDFSNQPNIKTVIFRNKKIQTYFDSNPDVYYQLNWIVNGATSYSAAVKDGTDLTQQPSTFVKYDGNVPPDGTEWLYKLYSNDAITTVMNDYTYAYSPHAYAIYSDSDNSFDIYKNSDSPKVGDVYNGKAVTQLFDNIEDKRQWAGYSNSNLRKVRKITIHDEIKPKHIDEFFNFFGADTDVLIDLDVSNIKLTNIIDSQPITVSFAGMSNIRSISGLESWSELPSIVTHLGSMFNQCTKLEELHGMKDWDVSNITSVYAMFSGCSNLTTIDNLSGWDFKSVSQFNVSWWQCKLENTQVPRSNWPKWFTDNYHEI